jgi:hypothetical protein
LLDRIEIDLRGEDNLTLYIDVTDNSLSRKWLAALNDILRNNLHLEKNYCWLGWTESERTAEYIISQINTSITAINTANLGYTINDLFTVEGTIQDDLGVDHERMNWLHRYFEDLQGHSGHMSPYWQQADAATRWHIRQLNLLCHEYESLVLSMRKMLQAPEWRRPSQLMCWLNAPRFALDTEDYKLFGVDTINRQIGGVYVGVNKAVGKTHWEVFNDENRSVDELITTGLRNQTEAAGDFDIEWARNPAAHEWQIKKIAEFRNWLVDNGFDPEDRSLTIGHPKVAQVNLSKTFGTLDYNQIWSKISAHLDVYKIRTSDAEDTYEYRWSDQDYIQQQIRALNARHTS